MVLTLHMINLLRRPDRRVQTYRHLKPYEGLVNISRFDAIDTGNPFGCGLSHKALIESIDDQPIIVIEDDIKVMPNFNMLPSVWTWLQTHDDWDIFVGGPSKVGKVTKVKDSPHGIDLFRTDDVSAFQFVIYHPRMKEIIKEYNPKGDPHESINAIDYWCGKNEKIRKVSCYPFMALQRESLSNLSGVVSSFDHIFRDIEAQVRHSL